MSKAQSTRERILDALQVVVRRDGPAAATLEAVAAQAQVSKGGLLYHFPSKEELFEGLMERLRTLAAADVAETGRSNSDLVRRYLEESTISTDAFSGAMLALLTLVGNTEVDAGATVREVLKVWDPPLRQAAGQDELARLIQLVGDGLYLRAMCGIEAESLDRKVIESLVARIEH